MSRKDNKERKNTNKPMQLAEQVVGNTIDGSLWFMSRKNMVLVLALFSFVLYFNTVFNDYSVDDNFVVNEVTEKGFSGLKEVFLTNWASQNGKGLAYRALSRASIAVEVGLLPSSPITHHFFNILYYILSVIVTFQFLLLVLGKRYHTLIFFSLLLFIAHPIHVEVVASLKSRDELFCYLFGMLYCLTAYKFYINGRYKYLLIAGACLILSWLSKEGAPQYIPVVLLTCFLFGKRNYSRLGWIATISVFIAISYFVFYYAFILKPVEQVGALYEVRLVFVEAQLKFITAFSERYGTAFYAMLYYLRLLFFPFPLSFFYGYDIIPVVGFSNPFVITSIFIHLALFVYALIMLGKKPVIGWLILFYFCSMAVFSNLVIPINGVVADRHAFMGSLPFCVLVMMLLFKITSLRYDAVFQEVRRKGIFLFLLFSIIIVFSIKTVIRNTEWKNRATISAIDAERNPHSAMAKLYHAVELQKALYVNKDSANLVPQIMKYQQDYIAIYDKDPVPYYRIGELYWKYYKDPVNAELNLNKALELNSKSLMIYYPLINLYQQIGDTAKESSLMDLLRVSITDAYEPYYFYGLRAFKKNEYESAVYQFEKALVLGCRDEEMIRFLKDYYKTYNRKDKIDKLNFYLNQPIK